mmetsp:Transcript_13460/g.56389  ORF Transcript_13460/g.56389 Transcript_13460/m.56389 type:complete len:255 (-) Transcript_13460:62-826(-)
MASGTGKVDSPATSPSESAGGAASSERKPCGVPWPTTSSRPAASTEHAPTSCGGCRNAASLSLNGHVTAIEWSQSKTRKGLDAPSNRISIVDCDAPSRSLWPRIASCGTMSHSTRIPFSITLARGPLPSRSRVTCAPQCSNCANAKSPLSSLRPTFVVPISTHASATGPACCADLSTDVLIVSAAPHLVLSHVPSLLKRSSSAWRLPKAVEFSEASASTEHTCVASTSASFTRLSMRPRTPRARTRSSYTFDGT